MSRRGCKKGGIVILNTSKSAEQIRKETGIKAKLATVDASKIAMETMRVPITNTTMIGALMKASGIIQMSGLQNPMKHRFGPIAEKNMKSCARAYDETKVVEG